MPQPCCVVERMNKTLMERVRCFLSEAKLLGMFWGEALYTLAYIYNISPSSALQNDVLDMFLYGKEPSYNHLCAFGYKAFVHILKDERPKLEVKIKQCVLLGYDQDEFGYRLYDPVEQKLVKRRVVVF